MSALPGQDALQQIVEYLNELRDVPLPEELQEQAGIGPVGRLLSSAPGFAELLADVNRQMAHPPAPVRRGPHGEVKLADMADEKALKRKAIELLGLDPALLDLPEPAPAQPQEAEEEEPPAEQPEVTRADAQERPRSEAQEPPEQSAEGAAAAEGIAALTSKVNEILAYLKLRRDIQTPVVMEGADENAG